MMISPIGGGTVFYHFLAKVKLVDASVADRSANDAFRARRGCEKIVGVQALACFVGRKAREKAR